MTDATRFQFTNASVPRAYDEYYVPRLFEPWARVLIAEADLRRGAAVLDVATGPGTVARLAAIEVGPGGKVVATDIARPMLDVARAKPSHSDGAPIEYVESSAAPLAVSSAAFDRVLCQQGLQFFPDRLGALREMWRALKPGGLVALAVWTEIERSPFFAAIHVALRATVPAELADLMNAPFSWPRGVELKAAAEEAGFRDVRLINRTLPLVFEGGLDQAVGSFSATPVSPGVAALPQGRQDAFIARLRRELLPLASGESTVRSDMNCNIIVGRV